jgi:hypothetical protein
VHDPQVQQQLATLLQLLRVDAAAGTLAEQLAAAQEVLRDAVLPGLTDASLQHSGEGLAAGQLDTRALGFSTGGAARMQR